MVGVCSDGDRHRNSVMVRGYGFSILPIVLVSITSIRGKVRGGSAITVRIGHQRVEGCSISISQVELRI